MSKLIAFDFETTPIKKGTPDALYLTAYGENNYKLSIPISGKSKIGKLRSLCTILEEYLLISDNNGAQFVAWNANKFDSYFIAKALLESDKWLLQPYMTASKSLRGLCVKQKRTNEMPKRQKLLHFEFLDGMAMTGITTSLGDKEIKMPDGNIKLKKGFLSTFAPDYRKLKSPDFERGEVFDANNKDHVKYAERDSEGLYHAMQNVAGIIKDLTGLELKPTIGNIAIRHFMDNIPDGVLLKRPTDNLLAILHGDIKRGGYCWAMKQYHGPVWKYDINQAYAAAMRDAELPAGDCATTDKFLEGLPGIYDCTISRTVPCKIPFYYKIDKQGLFSIGKKPARCWITSREVEHLKRDGWIIEIHSGYAWQSSFNMKKFVDRLEQLRATDKDGPGGPLGTMVKALGNNAYGKTLEQIWGQEFVFSKERPDGYDLYDSINSEANFIFSRDRKSFPKKYHLPQIGIFVTADVRCTVRDAALKEEEHFLYADTDGAMFSKPVHHLDVHPTRYGAWKQESDGYTVIIIGKKMYHSEDGSTAKGLIVKNLTEEDYHLWLRGKIPVQTQCQRQNILKFLSGRDMFTTQVRHGTDVTISKTVKCLEGFFAPHEKT